VHIHFIHQTQRYLQCSQKFLVSDQKLFLSYFSYFGHIFGVNQILSNDKKSQVISLNIRFSIILKNNLSFLCTKKFIHKFLDTLSLTNKYKTKIIFLKH